MAQKDIIIVDTDILIKVYRGDALKRKQLDKLKGSVAISIITALELMQGISSKRRLIELNTQLKAFQIIHLDVSISELSLRLFRKYSPNSNARVQDILIASTSIIQGFKLFTDNKKHK